LILAVLLGWHLSPSLVQAQGASTDLSEKTATELLELLIKLVEKDGRLYAFRAPRDQRPKDLGGAIYTPPRINMLFRYTVKHHHGTSLLGFRMDSYVEDVKARRQTKAALFFDYPEVDLGDVKSITLREGRVVDMDRQLGGHNKWTDHELLVELNDPVAVQTLKDGDTVEQSTSVVTLGFTSREQAQYAQRLIEAIGVASVEAAPCPSTELLEGRSEAEQQTLRSLYSAAIGVKERLRARRDSFLETHDASEVFPTFYYYVTSEGLKVINRGKLKRPDITLRQILSFYDAYEANRSHSLREKHWKAYYEAAETLNEDGIGSWSLVKPVGGLLKKGMVAHIEFDLPRALRSVLPDLPDMPADLAKELEDDFQALRYIFAPAAAGAFDDVSTVVHQANPGLSPATVDWLPLRESLSQFMGQWWRTAAWKSARGNALPTESAPQPMGDHDALADEGRRLCSEPELQDALSDE
jgi:hypothetical protein